jgi:hypothetical protein
VTGTPAGQAGRETRPHGFTLGVGVGALQQDAHLDRTLEAVDALLTEAGVEPVARVVVAAEGSPAAERIAAARGWTCRRILTGSPRTQAGAREAARRAAGGDVTLLVDGDVAVQAGWLDAALTQLETRDGLAGVGGAVDEAHWRRGALVGGRRDVDGAGAGGPARQLRDAALWRRAALDAVGGFDVWVPGDDEAEVAGRLRIAGYGLWRLGQTIAVRHGAPRQTREDFVTRLTGGRMNGPGIVLRRARGTMLFGEHARRYAGRVLLAAWLLLGAVVAIVGARQNLGAIWLWATAALLAFFCVLQQSLPRAFWSGMSALAEGLGIVRNLLAPIALPRVGAPPRPLPPPAEPKPAEPRAAPRHQDDDEPPPIVPPGRGGGAR